MRIRKYIEGEIVLEKKILKEVERTIKRFPAPPLKISIFCPYALANHLKKML